MEKNHCAELEEFTKLRLALLDDLRVLSGCGIMYGMYRKRLISRDFAFWNQSETRFFTYEKCFG